MLQGQYTDFSSPEDTEAHFPFEHLNQQTMNMDQNTFPETEGSLGSGIDSLALFPAEVGSAAGSFFTEENTLKPRLPPNLHISATSVETYGPPPPSSEDLEAMYPHLIGPDKLISAVTRQLNLVGTHAPSMTEPLARYFVNHLTPEMAESIRKIIVDTRKENNPLKNSMKLFSPPQQYPIGPSPQRIITQTDTETSKYQPRNKKSAGELLQRLQPI